MGSDGTMTIGGATARRAIRGLGIRAQEERAVGLLVLVFGLGEAGRGLGMNASDALFFLRFGVERLPWMYMGLGVLTFLAVLLYAAGLSRYGWRFLLALYLGVALLLVIERSLIPLGINAIYPALWLSVQVISWVLVTAGWSLASQSFDTRQAKRLFSLFASASITGGILGHAATGWLAETIGTENLFLVYAALLLVAFQAVRRLTTGLPQRRADPESDSGPLADVMAGVNTLRHSRLLQLIVASSVLFSVLYFSVWFPFNRVVSSVYPDEASLAGFLGNFTSIVMFSTLLLSLISNRIYARFGIVNVVLVVPLIYLAGFGMWIVEFSLVTAVILRFTHMVWINGAGWTAWNALFNVYHAERREQLRAFESGVPSQIGTSLSGVLLLLGERVLTTQQIFLLGGSAALTCALLCWRMRPAYGQALLTAIRSGLVDVFTGSPTALGRLGADSQARRTLVDSLREGEESVRRVAAELLGRLQIDEIDPLVAALDDKSAGVRVAAVEALGSMNREAAGGPIRSLLADPSAEVRRAAVRALGGLDQVGDWLESALADGDPSVRSEAAAVQFSAGASSAGLVTLGELLSSGDQGAVAAALRSARDHQIPLPLAELEVLADHSSAHIRQLTAEVLGCHAGERASELLLAAMSDEDRRVREAAASVAGRAGIPSGKLLNLLERGPVGAQRASVSALTVESTADREGLIEWTLRELGELEVLHLQSARLDHVAQKNGRPELLFLKDLLERRQTSCKDLVMRVLRKLGSEKVLDLVERGLASEDRTLRTQALEALETLGEPRIVRGFVPLLEADPEGAELPTLGQVLEALSRNPDPWIRAFALRFRARRLREQLKELRAGAERDSSPIVHEVWQEVPSIEGADMAETLETLSTMERILYLRRIPILEDLDPDDLHRIAEIAGERMIPEGAHLCREGELEDELYLIVEGEVAVTKEDDGRQKELRRIGAGQPVGELAILASQPRSASVRAIGGDLRVLVIEGVAFQAILRDRPAVGTAMLANLARRLSTMV